jgi:hypothetical protein
MTVVIIAGDTIIGKGRVKIVAPGNTGMNIFSIPAVQNPFGAGYQTALGLPDPRMNVFTTPAVKKAIQQGAGAGWQKLLGLPVSYQPGTTTSPTLGTTAPLRGQAPAAGAGPSGVSPNTIVQGQDGIGEEYRQRLNAYNNQAILARQALQGYDPSKGPLPGAAQEAHDQGMEIWKGLYGGTKMGQEGGAVGTFNPLMQAHGDVPSMAELWQGIGGGAPTAGPSQDAIKAAIARGVNQPGSGGFFVPPGSPSPVEQAQQQQLDTAAQAGSGTESSTALQRTNDYLRAFKLGAMNPNNYSLPGVDYSSIFK